jgi:hypothetical protein
MARNPVGGMEHIVVVRTFLSFSLDVEIEGRLPWRRPELPESGETT